MTRQDLRPIKDIQSMVQPMKIRKPSKNEAPRLPNSTFRTRGLTRSSPANLSSPALVIPSPSVIIHPPLHASSWSNDYLGNLPRFPCCLQGRSQLWSICYKSVLCKKCALTVRLTHRGRPFSAGNHCQLDFVQICYNRRKEVILTLLKRWWNIW